MHTGMGRMKKWKMSVRLASRPFAHARRNMPLGKFIHLREGALLRDAAVGAHIIQTICYC
jgi:hypothetical protein